MSVAITTEALKSLQELLKAPRRIAITTHHDPDGDAIGSSLGLGAVLEKLGHDVQVVLPNGPPEFLKWMPGYDLVIRHDRDAAAAEAAITGSEIVFCLDFNRTHRVKALQPALDAARTRVLIDHHLDPAPFATIAICDPSACSTSQLVFDILAAMGHEALIDRDAATCLYAGIMTDTGSFRFNSTIPHTFRVAAKLLDRGVAADRVYNAINDDSSEHRLRLLGFALSERMQVLPDLGVAIFSLGKEDLQRHNYQPGDTEGLVNYGLSIRGIRLSALFTQRKDEVRISLRSIGHLPVDKMTREHFDGGGHANAAGGRSSEPLEAAVDRFKSLLPAFISNHPA